MKLCLLTSGALTLMMNVVSVASADDNTDYCEKVHARAAADSALLFSPSLIAQFVKFPSVNPIDATTITAGATYNGYQTRALVSWSPLDFYKGFGVLDEANADCQQHAAMAAAINVLGQAADVGKLPALRKQVEYLQAQQKVWQNILMLTERRLQVNVITQMDAMTVRQQVIDLDRKLTQLQGQLDVMVSKHLPEVNQDMPSLAQLVEVSSMRLEEKTNHVRSLDPWTVGVSAGLIPPQASSNVEWFGLVSVGYNFGALTHQAQDNKYLVARRQELQTARYELRDQLNRFRSQVQAASREAVAEMTVIEAEGKRLASLRNALEYTQAIATPALLNAIDLQQIELESDRLFLEELSHQLAQWK